MIMSARLQLKYLVSNPRNLLITAPAYLRPCFTLRIKRVLKHVKALFTLRSGKKRSFYVEYRIKMPSGEYRWLADNHTVVFSNGKPECFVGNITDITFRKHAQEELLESFDLQKGYMNLLTSIHS